MNNDKIMVMPWEQLSPEALQSVVEEFITREVTDYGLDEVPLDTKVSQVIAQLRSGELLLVFDTLNQAVNLVLARELSM